MLQVTMGQSVQLLQVMLFSVPYGMLVVYIIRHTEMELFWLTRRILKQ